MTPQTGSSVRPSTLSRQVSKHSKLSDWFVSPHLVFTCRAGSSEGFCHHVKHDVLIHSCSNSGADPTHTDSEEVRLPKTQVQQINEFQQKQQTKQQALKKMKPVRHYFNRVHSSIEHLRVLKELLEQEPQ